MEFWFRLKIQHILWEKCFSCRNLFFKGRCLLWQVRYMYNSCKGIYLLFRQWSIICHIWSFRYMQLRRVQRCHLSTDIIIWHSVHNLIVKITGFWTVDHRFESALWFFHICWINLILNDIIRIHFIVIEYFLLGWQSFKLQISEVIITQ